MLAVLFGLTGGSVMIAAAGARRTDTSYERLLSQSRAYDVEVQNVGSDDNAILDRVGALPQVEEYSRIVFVPAMKAQRAGSKQPFSWDVTGIAMVDPNLGRTIEIPRLISGRLPDLSAPSEVVVNESFVRARAVGVGDEFSLQLATIEEVLQLFEGRPPIPTGPFVTLRIVGVWRVPHDVSIGEREGFMVMTPAFFKEYEPRAATLWGMFARLRNGTADTDAFIEATREIGAEEDLSIRPQAFQLAKVDRALGVQSSALWILAVVIALGGAFILGQALGRWIQIGADDHPMLRALGMSPVHRSAALVLPAVAIGFGAAAPALVVGLLGSLLVPVGLARTIEPNVGVFADAPVLLVGSAISFMFVVVVAGIAGSRLTGRRVSAGDERVSRASRVADALARGGFSPPVVTGVRLALEPGRGRNAVPVRSVLMGATLSIAAVVAAFLFGRSLELMTSAPAAYGWNWDYVGPGGEDPEFVDEVQQKLVASKEIGEISRVQLKTISFEGDEIDTIAFTPLKGSVLPSLLEGAYPATDDEIALATKTMRSAGVGVGDQARLPGSAEACGGEEAEGCPLTLRVVGRIVFWGEDADPDDGAMLTEQGQARIRGSEGFADFLIRIPSEGNAEATERAIRDVTGADALPPRIPTSIANLDRVRSMPVALAALLAALALATLVHALVTCVRRRARDLAILKTLGLVRRQVIGTVACQGTTMIGVALVVGLPLGVMAGRLAWAQVADRMGVKTFHALDLATLALGSLAVLVLANVVSWLPGRIAARVRPAVVLRSE